MMSFMDELQEKQKTIQTNYTKVIARINEVALTSGRDPQSIRLVVVTKTQPVDIIRCVIEAGATNLGENYIEEAIPKIDSLKNYKDIKWHMIGHLQSRKAENFYSYFDYIHSLDSIKLAKKICQFASVDNKVIPVWLEFNIGGEFSKFGWNISNEHDWDTILPDIEQIVYLPNLNVLGAMTIPPYFEDPEASRPFYQRLRAFQSHVINRLHPPNFRELSMGMSSDFEVAIQEGSTCLRIGQAILGSRTT